MEKRNCREVVQEVPREEEIVESDTEEKEILEERDAIPLRIQILGSKLEVDLPHQSILE